MRKYDAILFDMDGVLIESENLMCKVGTLALRDFGLDPKPEDFVPFIGCGEDRYIGGVAEKYGLTYIQAMKKRCYDYYGQYVKAEANVPPRVMDMLLALKAQGRKIAVCTSSDREKALYNVYAIGADENTFTAFVAGDAITNKKPDPEIYLKGAAAVGVVPERCLVVEDATNGIQAAHAAGMEAVGIPSTFPAEKLKELANPEYIIDTPYDLLALLEKLEA